MTAARMRPGPLNLITDVAGIRVGHAGDRRAATGCTVVLAERPATVAGEVRGGAPGTRETALLDPACMVEGADAVVLSGGSALGQAAADGAMRRLAADGRGVEVAGWRVPIVPAAILFDLPVGDKEPGRLPDYAALGAAAVAAAATGDFAMGNAGAGIGARAGLLKGGLGSASLTDPATGLTVGALAVANPAGSAVMPEGTLWAWPFERDFELGGQVPPAAGAGEADLVAGTRLAGHTTLVVVACDAGLTRAAARRVALMACDGLARAIRPVHTPFDGDCVFVLATGERAERPAAEVARIGAMAADCVARAIARGVFLAEPLPGLPGYRETFPGAFTRHR